MKHYALILTTLLSLLIPAQSWGGDLDKGAIAFQKGDVVIAVEEFRPYAEQGNVRAQLLMGMAYQKGNRDGFQDYKKAVKWYTLAAEQGHADAQSNLGAFYGLGLGVLQASVNAHMWANIAASNGEESAIELRNIIAKEMTPSQLENAQDLARECVAKDYKGC